MNETKNETMKDTAKKEKHRETQRAWRKKNPLRDAEIQLKYYSRRVAELREQAAGGVNGEK